MQKILKNERGSVALFVLLSALFFLVVVTGVAVSFKNKEAQIDSQFEKIKLSYEKDAEQVYNEKIYKTITFDANGGTVSTTSKRVKVGEQYGELPTPIRPGYTFKGWNGKNMFDPDKMSFSNSTHTTGSEEISLQSGKYDRILSMSQWTPSLDETYKLVIVILENTFDKQIQLRTDSRFYIKQYTNSTISVGYTNTFVTDLKTKEDFTDVTLGSFWIWTQNTVTGNFRIKLALYQGESAPTEYEPYYITSSTTVVQTTNHTLTAIWEEN